MKIVQITTEPNHPKPLLTVFWSCSVAVKGWSGYGQISVAGSRTCQVEAEPGWSLARTTSVRKN